MGKHFDVDPTGFVNVYTDGACIDVGTSRARAGIGVWFRDNSPLNVSAPVIGPPDSNVAEIQAVTKAAEVARVARIAKLRIHTDSEVVYKSITEWIPGWKRNGWVGVNGKPIANQAELQKMDSALKPLQVELVKVPGHEVPGNIMADRLAREGAERYRR